MYLRIYMYIKNREGKDMFIRHLFFEVLVCLLDICTLIWTKILRHIIIIIFFFFF